MAKYYRFDSNGNLLVEKTFDTVSYRFGKLNEYVLVRKGKKWGVAFYKNFEIVVPIEYDRIEKNLFDKSERLEVYKSDQFSIIDINNNILVPTGFRYIDFSNQTQNLGRALLSDKVGVLNKNGDIIIEPKYVNCEILSDDRIIVTDSNELFLTDRNGIQISNKISGNRIIVKKYFENNVWLEKYFHLIDNSKYGVLDSNFNVLLECKYDDYINFINNDTFFTKYNGKNFVLNHLNKIIATFDFTFEFSSEHLLLDGRYNYIIRKDKSYSAKYGILNDKYEIVLPMEYDWIDYTFGVWKVKKGRSEYILDDNYNIIENSKYKRIGNFEKEGISCVEDENFKYNFISKSGNQIFTLSFDAVILGSRSTLHNLFQHIRSKYRSGLCGVCRDSKWGYVDLSGNLKIECKYDEVSEFDKSGAAIVKFNSKWGVIDLDGNTVIDFKYDSIIDFDADLKLIISKKDENLGVIDFNENEIIPFNFTDLYFDENKLICGISKKPLPKKQPLLKKIEPITLCDSKLLDKHNNLIHEEVIRVFVLAIVSGHEEDLSNRLYIVDVVRKDFKTATFISGYSGGGTWDEQTFIDNDFYNGEESGFTVFDFIREDEKIKNLVKDYICEIDEELDEYQYKSLKHFKEVGDEGLKLLYSVWYNESCDYTDVSKNDKKRIGSLLKKCRGIRWSNWNFKI